MGLPRVEEIFETRPPQFKAVMAESDGKVKSVEEKGKNKIITIISSDTGEEIEYAASPNIAVSVAAGDLVGRGQQLSEGHVDLKEMFALTGSIDAVARYIIREVQSIYFPTGDSINDKHVELITRQMFARMKVIDSGDTDLLVGDVVEKRRLYEENIKATANKKKEATAEQLIMGISKVALSTDSFLSAASFQETAKILIESATVGKEDNMVGLKENVIIGRLIPAGTGFNRSIEEE
jgi:DNA-directed RNA polymerase subunit beta'